MLTLPRHRRTDPFICHVSRGSISFAARSYFRLLDIGHGVQCARNCRLSFQYTPLSCDPRRGTMGPKLDLNPAKGPSNVLRCDMTRCHDKRLLESQPSATK